MKTSRFKKVFAPVKGTAPMACTKMSGYAR